MKVLISILSCHSLRYCEQSLRDTWIPEIPSGIDYKFFLGRREGIDDSSLILLDNDEVKLDVDDSFEGITKKTVATQRWALENGYDYMYKCDLDTLVRPTLLINSGFQNFEYSGGRNGFFASGGSGYWLSKRSMEVTSSKPVVYGPEEDLHTAYALQEKGVQLHDDPRYKYYPGDVMDDSTISYHLSSIRSFGKIKYDPQWMYQTWEDQKKRDHKSYSTEPTQKAPVANANRALRFRRLRNGR